MKKRLAFLLALLLLTSCAADADPSKTATPPTAAPTASAATEEVPEIAGIDTKEMDFTFTDRELSGSYDVHKAVTIHGNGSTAAITGNGASLIERALTITQEGVYILSGSFTDMMIVIRASEQDKVQLVLDNASISNATGPCIHAESADKVFITLPEGTSSSLTDGTTAALAQDDTSLDAALFSRADLCINGSGSLRIEGQNRHGVVSKDDLIIVNAALTVNAAATGLDGKDCVMIRSASITVNAGSNGIRSDNTEDENRGYVYLQDSTVSVTAGSDGLQAETVLMAENCTMHITTGSGSSSTMRSADGSWKGLKSGGDMLLNGGSVTIDSQDDCIHSNASIVILDGSFALSSGDDGVHADDTLTVGGGDIRINRSYEGLEAGKLLIRGGHIELIASDDGLNAAGGADGSALGNRFGRGRFSSGVGEIEISGGYVYVDSSGDGIDSNANITISGGVTLVSGPVSSGNAAFDYDGTATVTGGILVAAGASGMAQSFTTAENQGAMMLSLSRTQSAQSFALVDADGQVIVAFTPGKSCQSIVITAPEIQQGQTYTLVSGAAVDGADSHGFARNTTLSGGTTLAQVEMTSLLYGQGGGHGMWQKPGGGGPGKHGR